MRNNEVIFYIKRVAVIPIILLFAIIQVTLLDAVNLFGIKPDILLGLVLFFGFRWGGIAGFVIGLFSGFTKDIFSGTPFGIDTFSFALTGIVAGVLGRIFYAETTLAQLFLSFWTAFLNHIIYFVVYNTFSHPLSLSDAMRFVILPSSAYTALSSVIIFFILRKSFREG